MWDFLLWSLGWCVLVGITPERLSHIREANNSVVALYKLGCLESATLSSRPWEATVHSQQGNGDPGISERISSADSDLVNHLSIDSEEDHVSKEQLVLPLHTRLNPGCCQTALPYSSVSSVF